jgi:surfeit locus 1 family protein
MVGLTALGIAFFCTLGSWQLRRASYKDQLFADFASSSAQSETSLDAALRKIADTRYVRVSIRGEFLPSPAILLDSQRHASQIGVGVYSLFVPSDDTRRMLIARGFVPIAPDRSRFPAPDVPSGELVLTGLLAAPPSSGIKLSENDSTALDADRWLATRIDPLRLAERFKQPIVPYVLLLDADHSAGFAGRDWKPASFGPDKHRGYALTWFGLALTVFIVFLLLHWRRAPKE